MSSYLFDLKTEGQIAAYFILQQETTLLLFLCKFAAGLTAVTDFTRHCDSIEVLNELY
jgi:hypothetical protein